MEIGKVVRIKSGQAPSMVVADIQGDGDYERVKCVWFNSQKNAFQYETFSTYVLEELKYEIKQGVKFSLGDTVELRSDKGPYMVVDSIRDARSDSKVVTCLWWDGQNYKKEHLLDQLLNKIT